MGLRFFIGCLIFLFLISFISASVTCTPNLISVSYKEGESTSLNLLCVNSINSPPVSISKTGSYFNIDTNVISQSTNVTPSQKTINVSFDKNAPKGIYIGYIDFNDGISSSSLAVVMNVEEKVQTGCFIDIFPTILNNVKIVQGEKKTRNIQISIPSCYTSAIKLNGVTLQTDSKPIQLGELSIGQISPGNSVIIPLEFDANGVSSGQYSDTLQFLMYDLQGNKINVLSVSVSVLVTQGIQAITNFSLNDLPVCSVSSIEMSLNNSQKLTCSFTNPNINIHPLIDSKYIKGLSVSETANQYIYEFQPILIGQTTIGAEFLYKNAPLGSIYQQDIRISYSGGTPVSGVTTNFVFYQNGIRKEVSNLNSGETIIQVIDNRTNNLLSGYKLYINGVESNSTINLLSEKNYEIRSSVPGYIDNLINFSVSKISLAISIQPSKSWYFVGEIINITSINDTSFTANDIIITSPYTLNSEGNIIIKSFKEGYETSNLTIEVRNQIIWKAMTPSIEEWKKRKNVVIELNENNSWSVEFEELIENSYQPPVILASGTGLISFKISDYGRYTIKSGEAIILTKTIEKKGLVGWLPDWEWYYYLLVIGLILGIIYLLFFREGGKEEPGVGFEMRQ